MEVRIRFSVNNAAFIDEDLHSELIHVLAQAADKANASIQEMRQKEKDHDRWSLTDSYGNYVGNIMVYSKV